MRRTHSFARTTCIVIGIAIAVVLACDDDPTPPPPPAATMDSAWPNADGLEWNYDFTTKGWSDSTPDSLYATPEEVPPLPPLQDLAAQLATPIPGSPAAVETAGYVLRFDGTATTASGITGQNLVSEIVVSADAAASVSHSTVFVHRLAAARPDLRARIAATYPTQWNQTAGPLNYEPLFLSGAVYEKTAAHIGAYGDLDSLLAWKWLEPDVSTGREFVHQLVPSLADDVFLHARVLGPRTVTVPSGTYQQVLDVLYAVDYGVSQVVDETQQNLGYTRSYSYGSIAYAADVGPVESVERHEYPEGPLPDPSIPSLAELTIQHRRPPAKLR
jgi:hypothetical protein